MNKMIAELTTIKNRDSVIRRAFKLFKKTYPKYSIMGIYETIAEKSGFSAVTIRRILAGGKYK